MKFSNCDNVELFCDDCLKVLPDIRDGSVDAVITDLPYGVTNKISEAGKWDHQLPMSELWNQFWRVLKPNGVCVLFSQGMFTAELMMSQPNKWRYNLIWDKCRSSGFLNSKRMPLRRHEDICVFYRSLPTYNIQLEDLNGRNPTHKQGNGIHKDTNKCYGSFKNTNTSGVEGKKFPGSILSFPRPHCTGHHPTEKSVDLCRWLIRTFTNPGETVLDATMGSGTTIVASLLEGRRGIGIENDRKYFEIAKERIGNAKKDTTDEAAKDAEITDYKIWLEESNENVLVRDMLIKELADALKEAMGVLCSDEECSEWPHDVGCNNRVDCPVKKWAQLLKEKAREEVLESKKGMNMNELVRDQLVHTIGCIDGSGEDNGIIQIGYVDMEYIDSRTSTAPVSVFREFNRKFKEMNGVELVEFGAKHNDAAMVHQKVLQAIDSMNTDNGLPPVGKSYRVPELKRLLKIAPLKTVHALRGM